MISVECCSQVSLQHLGFCHYPYTMCRIKSETLANKINHFRTYLNKAEEFLFHDSKATIISQLYL